MSNFLTGLNQLDPSVKRHNGGGSSFTLDENGTTQATRLVVGGVEQVPNVDFTVSGTTLSTTSATPSGTNNVVTFQYFKSGTVNTATAVSAGGVNNAAMADDAIGIAELSATGTASSSTFLRGDNAWATPAAGFTLTSESATTSGSGVTISGISGAKLIYVILSDVGTNGTGDWHMQIGDAGGLETTGYHSYLSKITTSTSSESIANGSEWIIGENTHTAHHIEGHVVLTLQDETNNDWVMHTVAATDDERFVAAGHKSLSAALTQIQIRTDDTFDEGVFSVLYM